MAFTRELLRKHWWFRRKLKKMACDGAKVDYTGQYKNNGIK